MKVLMSRGLKNNLSFSYFTQVLVQFKLDENFLKTMKQ